MQNKESTNVTENNHHNQTISHQQLNNLLQRFPHIELSYETICHKKVSEKYEICVCIPTGKKYFAWFSFYENKNVCYLLDMNKERRIVKATIIDVDFDPSLSLGTIAFGVFLETDNVFIIEDIYMYKGIPLSKEPYYRKLGYAHQTMLAMRHTPQQSVASKNNTINFYLPVLWFIDNEIEEHKIPEKFTISYPIHHLQYRALRDIVPYLNISYNKKIKDNEPISTIKHPIYFNHFKMNFGKPQYKQHAVFQVKADIQFDIYHLFAYENPIKMTHYNIAYIPNYKTSVFMNNLFRNIKENSNLDYIEESDDEDDFQNTKEDKYVDLEKTLNIECEFNMKFKKWVPLRVIHKPCRIVNVKQL